MPRLKRLTMGLWKPGLLQDFGFVSAVVSLSLLLAAAVGTAQTSSAAAQEDSGSEALDTLLGAHVTVHLRNGTTYTNAKVLRVRGSDDSEKPVKLRVQLSEGGGRTWSLTAIQSIELDGTIVFRNDDRPTESPTKRVSPEERGQQRAAEEHEKWLGRLAARDIEPWSKLTEAEHETAIKTHKERYEKVAALLPGLRLFETEHFLFCTNIDPQQVGGFIASLDRMYAWMQQTYGIAKSESVWRGKASIFAFARESEFVAFERQFMKNNVQPGTAGLCHFDGRRNVCIAVHQGTDVDYFGVVLVHETSHGFIHCYKTPVRVPSWVNEGMAEVIASLMVPTSKGVARKEKQFLKALQSVPAPRLGEEFFVVDKNIPFNRYGGASSMTRFLLQSNERSYVRFINLLKEGVPWEEALDKTYHATKEQLVASYGRWLGIPNLRP